MCCMGETSALMSDSEAGSWLLFPWDALLLFAFPKTGWPIDGPSVVWGFSGPGAVFRVLVLCSCLTFDEHLLRKLWVLHLQNEYYEYSSLSL